VADDSNGSHMILYHFTGAEYLDGIAARWLVPAIGTDAKTKVLTLGTPVVWFTSNAAPLWTVGLGYSTEMWMLTVDLKRRHLHHWRRGSRTWKAMVSTRTATYHFVGTEILEAMSLDQEFGAERLTDTSNYWICSGVVRPYHIIQCQHISYVVEGASRIR